MLLAITSAALAFGSICSSQAAGAPGGASKSKSKRVKVKSNRASLGDKSQLKPVIGVGPGFYWEDTDRKSESERGGTFFESEEEEDLVSDGSLTLQAWALFPVFFDRLYLGGGIAWYNKYAIKPGDQEEDDDDSFEIGQMLALSAQVDFLVPRVVSDLNILIGVRGGGLVAFPGGELLDELEGLDRTGFSVTPDLPRVGAFIAPHVGASWPLSPKLRIRADFSAQFSSLNLWDGSAEAAGITSTTSSGLKTVRYGILIGPELLL